MKSHPLLRKTDKLLQPRALVYLCDQGITHRRELRDYLRLDKPLYTDNLLMGLRKNGFVESAGIGRYQLTDKGKREAACWFEAVTNFDNGASPMLLSKAEEDEPFNPIGKVYHVKEEAAPVLPFKVDEPPGIDWAREFINLAFALAGRTKE